jgi:hypothetical protein
MGYVVAILGTVICFVVTNVLYGGIPGISVPDTQLPASLRLVPQVRTGAAWRSYRYFLQGVISSLAHQHED